MTLPPTARALLTILAASPIPYRDPRMTVSGLTWLRHNGMARVVRVGNVATVELTEKGKLIAGERTDPMTTITDKQVEALRDAAGQAGDFAQVAICERALDGLDDESEIPADEADFRRARAMTVESARAECARVIREGA